MYLRLKNKHKKCFKMLLLTAFSVFNILQEINTQNIIIQTQNGFVRGYEKQTNNDSYYAFQGIPFAEPPVGKLRFEPPVPKGNWTGTWNATKLSDMCIQGFPPNGSENCLFLNVYVPKADKKISKFLLPVMVWIYGGAFDSGSANDYQPDYLIKRHVIIVTFNYRLGIFGFLSTGDLVAPGNNGLKDQVLALRWVKNNIRNFGGDPNKVTIFGESAGAASVSYHLQSPLSRGLFQRGIMESGVSLSSWALSRYIPDIVKRIGAELSINTNSSTELKDGLKKVDPATLQLRYRDNVVLEYLFHHDPRSGLAFGPVTEPEHVGAFFTGKSHELLSQGRFSKVPCIIGFNSLEAGYFTGPLSAVIRTYALTNFDFNNINLIPPDLHVQQNKKSIVASKIHNFYFGNAWIAFSILNFTKFLSDDLFVRPTRENVRLIYKETPTYFYRFSYEGNIPDSTNKKYEGVPHSEELFYLWKFPNNGTPEGQDKITSDRVLSLWTNFAKDGNPTPQPVSNVTWKKSDENFTYLDIGTELRLLQFPEKRAMQFWDKIYSDYGRPSFDTY